ncbi:MAG: RNA polymerase factor sigma-54 [Spirochaetales bacterium]|uniref:RNA polymerase factor sigma-54 n=1 Tax=Candidatus Thalassospirochaeta sargassi TaxID=3119039 RepID=A0AAJ1MIA9_9SPIO|nr:RNA polymerase factor sigma-54 [Spirochaetales bacterium]
MQYQKPVIIQEQKLKLSPQMYQSIQLMALPLNELNTRIQEELEKNPALEIVSEKPTVSLEEAEGERITKNDEFEYFENTSDPGFSTTSGRVDTEAADAKHKFIEGTLSRPETLQDNLIWQLAVQKLTEREREIGELLIHNLDSNGFHAEDPKKLVDPEEVDTLERIISLIQTFEPVGTCTTDYIESLLIQIDLDFDSPEKLSELVEYHFEQLKKNKTKEIMKAMSIDAEELAELINYLKHFNPFPGREFSDDEVKYVIPDLVVELKEGEFVIILNDEEIPVLGLNTFFQELNRDKSKEHKEASQFVKANIQEARWFIRSVNQRNETLLKITSAIVDFQRNFFLKGPKYLAPLTLKDIAETVSVHETTVSRISNAKYIQTEWGILPLKYFFSNSVSGSGTDGTSYSKGGVKEIMKEIIEEYTGEKKLSDQKISDLLKQKGINIARRTVAKYRKELNIDSSYTR